VYDTAKRRVSNHHLSPYPDLRLPSLPEVVLRTMDSCRQAKSYRQISTVISAVAGPKTISGAIQKEAPVWQNRRPWVELTIGDDGPGLPPNVQQQLFQPVASSKGSGHSGPGLSIVKQLIDDMEGIISCRTGTTGTRFQILLPAIVDEPDQ